MFRTDIERELGQDQVPGSGHSHAPAEKPAVSASVALDIGPGRGALILYPDDRFRGLEIEISATDHLTDHHRVHTGVHERQTHSGSRLTAIFGSLAAGEYLIWLDADTPGPTVTVDEASVAELALH